MGTIGDLNLNTKSSGESYEFLDKELPTNAVGNASLEQLVERLQGIVSSVHAARNASHYESVRGQYIALNRALNQRGQIAPRFRPSLSSGARIHGRTEAGNYISNDHQVIDLEWLSRQCGYDGQRAQNLPLRWQGLFGQRLDLEMAQAFAGTAGSSETKAADILALSLSDQVQLRSIQTEKVRSWWRCRSEEKRKIVKAICTSSQTNRALAGKELVWPDYYLASKCGDFAGLSANTWIELISGKTVPGSTLSSVKKRVQKLLNSKVK